LYNNDNIFLNDYNIINILNKSLNNINITIYLNVIMKYLETSFEDYIKSSKNINLHKNYEKLYNKLPDNFKEFNNIIVYGPKGSGKYTQFLNIIEKYSPSNLKYERKLTINIDKKNYEFKISDIHYEVDISLLGCNAKLLWHEFYNQVIDIIQTKTVKQGIIVCKNFHYIHSELLDIFYSYVQDTYNYIDLKFILITENVSFIPDNILSLFNIINYKRPTTIMYNKIIKPSKLEKNMTLKNIINIKDLKNNIHNFENSYIILVDSIVDYIKDYPSIDLALLRDKLYDLLIFQIDLNECIWNIVYKLLESNLLNNEQIYKINIEIYKFFKYYNNNFRPIFHLERIILYLCSVIYEDGFTASTTNIGIEE